MKNQVKEKIEEINIKLDDLIQKLKAEREKLNNIIQPEDERRVK